MIWLPNWWSLVLYLYIICRYWELNFESAARAVRLFELCLDPLLQTLRIENVQTRCLLYRRLFFELLKAYATAQLPQCVSGLAEFLCGYCYVKLLQDRYPDCLLQLLSMLLLSLQASQVPVSADDAFESKDDDADANHEREEDGTKDSKDQDERVVYLEFAITLAYVSELVLVGGRHHVAVRA